MDYAIVISIVCFLLYTAIYGKEILPDKQASAQVLINLAFTISIFFVLLQIYAHHYSHSNYVLQNPTDWLLSSNSSCSCKPTKFELVLGRKFIIDSNEFSFLSEIQEGKYISLILVFLFVSFILSMYPFFEIYQFNITDNYLFVFFFCLFLFILLFILLLMYLNFFYRNLSWKFVKESQDRIKFSISNPSRKLINGYINKSVIESLEIFETNAFDLNPNSRIFRKFKAKTKIYLLKITIPSYINSDFETDRQFNICIHSSREFVVLIKDILMKWLIITEKDI